MPTIVVFPGGLKAYLEASPRERAEILRWRPEDCALCGVLGIWHCHGWRSRYAWLDGQSWKTSVPQVRCRGCRATTTLLPEGILPRLHYGLDTVGPAVEAYEQTAASYRQAALDVSGTALPAGQTLSAFFGGVEAPPLGPSSIYRWVQRFSAGAGHWWAEIAAEAQGHLDHALSPPAPPESIRAKGRSPEKSQDLANAWMLLWALCFLLSILGQPTSSWPYALLHFSRRPRLLDHTGWFALGSRAPP